MINQEKAMCAVQREQRLAQWMRHDVLGRYAAAAEQSFFAGRLPAPQLAAVLTLTALAEWWPASVCRIGPAAGGADIVAALPRLPLADGSVHTLLLPHTLDICPQHDVLLEECFRVLQPYGRLVVSGFNPHSLWRFGRTKTLVKAALPLAETKRLLQAAGFVLNEGRFMVYIPPLERGRNWRFMESAGNRWWPHAAAVYGLVASKNILPLTPADSRNRQIMGEVVWSPAICTTACRP